MESDAGTRESPVLGAGAPLGPPAPAASWLSARWFQALYETPLVYTGILDEQGRVLDGNRAAIEGCGLTRADVIGRPLWQCGWWAPDPDLGATVREWCERVLLGAEPLRARTRFYRGDGTSRTVDLSLCPVRSDDGAHRFVVATGLDVKDVLPTQSARERRVPVDTAAAGQVAASPAEDLQAARDAERWALERLRTLAEIGCELGAAESVDELIDIVLRRGVSVLGADAGAVAVRTPTGPDVPPGLDLAVTGRLGEQVRVVSGRLALDSPLPSAHVVRTGRPLVLPDRDAGLAFAPEMASVYAETQRSAWAFEPLAQGSRVLGCLGVAWTHERSISPDEVRLVEAFAAQCSQALARIEATQAQRGATLRVQRLNESLQRSLLTRPPTPDCLEIAVRYQPAVQDVQVGGDWYDAFQLPDGTTLLSVGDVAGHNDDAAASMAQLRNLLRGLAVGTGDGPAGLLTRLDHAVTGLGLSALATAVVAIVVPQPDGACVVIWSSAGHLPPMVRMPNGRVQVHGGSQDLLLGIDPRASRQEHALYLPEGATMLLYTDGLVERRGESLDDGCTRLASALAEVGAAAPDVVCDRLLETVLGNAPDDDVAMLALRPRRGSDPTVRPGPPGPPGSSLSA